MDSRRIEPAPARGDVLIGTDQITGAGPAGVALMQHTLMIDHTRHIFRQFERLPADQQRVALAKLQEHGIAVVPDSPKYRGESPANLVNLPRLKGVQLELSDELIATLFSGPKFSRGRCPKTTERFAGLVEAIRQALQQYEQSSRRADAKAAG